MPPTDINTVLLGDCLDVLPTLSECSIDAVVTDPPYGLGFMGKDWDHGVPGEHFWREALRVAKPGAHLLAFGGTRTFHRLACAIEDAGWEIRDTIMWVYGSGFPKSMDVSQGIDKLNERQFEDRYELGRHIRECRERLGISRKEVNIRFNSVAVCNHWEAQDQSNALLPTPEHWEQLKKWLGCDPKFDALIDRIGAEREVVGVKKGAMSSWRMDGETKFSDRDITVPATSAARRWQGWGTALKPAWEPIIVARKPLDGTVAANVLRYGTGAINVDGCRVETAEEIMNHSRSAEAAISKGRYGDSRAQETHQTAGQTLGRWPANLIHDGSEEVVGLFPETKSGFMRADTQRASDGGYMGGFPKDRVGARDTFGDEGSAARFFYCAKANRQDRGEGNIHPTVKPTALMRYLVRLVTPPGGIVLDPFTGSGSTGKAARLEGFDFLGIEKDEEYIEIARARVKHAERMQGLPIDDEPQEGEAPVQVAKASDLQLSLL